MSNITLTIDGIKCEAKENEFILNVARANDIFVPAVCYLDRCSPTLACRLCLVEANGKQVYACNAKSKDGMEVITTTQNIEDERKAIMEVYDVNHPLQCGVCDQSGECELQNYSLYMNVDNQRYSIKDTDRPASSWGVMKYDPGLCIVCEKCVTVCKDMIGSGALATVKKVSDSIDPTFKEQMPKDAYAMWNKLNKSLIGFDDDKCIDCGECIAVCPVGALVSTDFQYKSNAWELEKIPASNPYSSDCSLMYYEVKHENIENNQNKIIYRVTNDSHYTSLSGAARFAYDVSNKVQSKNESDFNSAVEAIKACGTIKFNSFITNEEAYMLQKLKEKLDIKLVNDDAYRYQKFLKDFSSTSGESLYNGSLQTIHDSNFLISVGSYFKSDAPSVRYAFNNAISMNKGAGVYFHPMEDISVENFGKKGKSIISVVHKPNAEEAILFLVLDLFGENLPEDLKKYLDSTKQTVKTNITEVVKETIKETVKDEETGEDKVVSKIVSKEVTKEIEVIKSSLCGDIVDNSLLETITTMRKGKENLSLIIGEDIIYKTNNENLAKLCGLIQKYTKMNVVIIPSSTNSLGVSMICDLDEKAEGKIVGYNEDADFTFSNLGDGDIDMPALNQQEGTFVNIDKNLVPTNAALAYNGYELNDIVNCVLDCDVENTIDYTKELFDCVEFDKLENHFTNDAQEHRGYKIKSSSTKQSDIVNLEPNFQTLQNDVVYMANPINKFNQASVCSSKFEDECVALYLSEDALEYYGISKGSKVEVDYNNGSIILEAKLDKQLKGKIGYIPTYDKNIKTNEIFPDNRFRSVIIKKVV